MKEETVAAALNRLRGCAKTKDLHAGILLHADLSRRGLPGRRSHVANALVHMYAQCGALRQASESLVSLPSRDVFSWNALIAGYARHGHSRLAFQCFHQMQSEGLHPDAVTLTCLLKACACTREADRGERIHRQISRQGLLDRDAVVGNALVDMYAKCGAMARAKQVLEQLPVHDVFTWSSIIAGYANQHFGKEALLCFDCMKSEGLLPNAVTFNGVLKACGNMKDAATGAKIHEEISEQGLLLKENTLLGNALIDMYAKCGELRKAQKILEELPSRDVISWSTLISGYIDWGHSEDALLCFEQMQQDGIVPNTVTFICTLKACAGIGAVDRGELIHHNLTKQGLLKTDEVLATALVDMYSKCGALDKAQELLADMAVGDICSWSAILTGYIQQGRCQQALDCFELMKCHGLSLDAVAFSCVLNACSRAGLLEESESYFSEMCTKYGITPEIEHLTCMFSMFWRAGLFDKAASLIQKLTTFDSSAIWEVLLVACQKLGDVKVGKWAFRNVMQFNKAAGLA